MSLADDLIALSRRIAPVEVPGVSGVFVRLLTVAEMLRLFREKEDGDAVAVLLGACDATGARLFPDDRMGDVRALDFITAKLIVAAVMKHNGMSAPASEVEEEGKAGRTP